MSEVIIVNKKDFESKKEAFKKEGVEKIHILSSFDKTFTKALFNGKKIISFIAKLRNGNYISKEYASKAQELYDKYHAIEISTNLNQKDKNEKMLEWWTTHYKLLVECGLNKATIGQAVDDMIKDGDICLREGTKDFLKVLDKKNISLIIISSSGLGNAVMDFLEKQKFALKNIHFVGNTLEFDASGKFTGIKDNKVIHVFNKNEASLKSLPIYKELEKRKNVILLGDSLGDLEMISGFNYDNLLKIGFFNYSDEENIEDFKKNFDVVITDDGDFKFVNEMLKDILD